MRFFIHPVLPITWMPQAHSSLYVTTHYCVQFHIHSDPIHDAKQPLSSPYSTAHLFAQPQIFQLDCRLPFQPSTYFTVKSFRPNCLLIPGHGSPNKLPSAIAALDLFRPSSGPLLQTGGVRLFRLPLWNVDDDGDSYYMCVPLGGTQQFRNGMLA